MSTEHLSNKEMITRLLDRTENIPAMASDIKGIKDHLATLNSKVADHEQRVRGLENWRSYITGGLGLAIALGIPDIVTIASNL